MDEAGRIALYTLFAGACIPLGGLLACHERIHPAWLETEFRHFIIAFGGGILVAAVALVLVPDGMAYVDHSMWGVLTFAGGGAIFFALEHFLGARRREKPQLMAMLLDYVPESLALGGARIWLWFAGQNAGGRRMMRRRFSRAPNPRIRSV